jgi:hypothetical protein
MIEHELLLRLGDDAFFAGVSTQSPGTSRHPGHVMTKLCNPNPFGGREKQSRPTLDCVLHHELEDEYLLLLAVSVAPGDTPSGE